MEWLKNNIPFEAELDDIAFRQFFFYFIGSYLFGNNRLGLTCKLGPFLMDSSSLS